MLKEFIKRDEDTHDYIIASEEVTKQNKRVS